MPYKSYSGKVVSYSKRGIKLSLEKLLGYLSWKNFLFNSSNRCLILQCTFALSKADLSSGLHRWKLVQWMRIWSPESERLQSESCFCSSHVLPVLRQNKMEIIIRSSRIVE